MSWRNRHHVRLFFVMLLFPWSTATGQSPEARQALNEILDQLEARQETIASVSYSETTETLTARGDFNRWGWPKPHPPVPPEDTVLQGSCEATFDFTTDRIRIVSLSGFYDLVGPKQHKLGKQWSEYRLDGMEVTHYSPRRAGSYTPGGEKASDAEDASEPKFRSWTNNRPVAASAMLHSCRWLALFWASGRLPPVAESCVNWKEVSRPLWKFSNRDILHPDGKFGPDRLAKRGSDKLQLIWREPGVVVLLVVKRHGEAWLPEKYIEEVQVKELALGQCDYHWSLEDGTWEPAQWHFVRWIGKQLSSDARGVATEFAASATPYEHGGEILFPELPDERVWQR